MPPARKMPLLLIAAGLHDQEEATDKVNMLLAHGADSHTTSADGQNLCHFAAIRQNIQLLRKAIEQGVDHRKRDRDGSTPLHYATALVANDNHEVIELLVNGGCDVNASDLRGLTPLYLAVSSNQVENIVPLIRSYADLRKASLQKVRFSKLQVLARPEMIQASPQPLKFALELSYMYHRWGYYHPLQKARYEALSAELEDVAVQMVDAASPVLLLKVLTTDMVEMAITDGCKKVLCACSY